MLDYGFSCMGYEIAGGLGVKLARPDARGRRDARRRFSYMMLNSEIASSVMLGKKLTIVLLDNRGFGCINRLQMATGGANFNNLLTDTHARALPAIDFVAHAESMGAVAEKVTSIAELETALKLSSKGNDRTTVLVIDTDPLAVTDAGGHWWDVAVPEVERANR
jgi:3D-(3,5/4)-trihydroxycyclohexane-1,2-dione acylhydrolase (decyclizing)